MDFVQISQSVFKKQVQNNFSPFLKTVTEPTFVQRTAQQETI